jgi:hypothetical protein
MAFVKVFVHAKWLKPMDEKRYLNKSCLLSTTQPNALRDFNIERNITSND